MKKQTDANEDKQAGRSVTARLENAVDMVPTDKPDGFNAYAEPGEQLAKDIPPLPSALSVLWRTLGEALEGRLSQSPPRRDWLLKDGKDGVFPLGKCGVLGAGGGTGKTTVLCQLAVAVALGEGQEWLGFQVASPGKVVLALGEEDLDEVHRRLYRIGAHLGLDLERWGKLAENIIALPLAGETVALVKKDLKGEIGESPFLQELRGKLLQTPGVRLVILDPLSRFAGAETETDNAAATRFVQYVESLSKLGDKPAVLIAHHSSKSSQADGKANIRGASAISDGFRWAATMTEAEDFVRLEQFKTNYSKHFKSRLLEWVQVKAPSSGWDIDLGAVLSKVVDQNAANEAVKEASDTRRKAAASRKAKANGGNDKQDTPPSTPRVDSKGYF